MCTRRDAWKYQHSIFSNHPTQTQSAESRKYPNSTKKFKNEWPEEPKDGMIMRGKYPRMFDFQVEVLPQDFIEYQMPRRGAAAQAGTDAALTRSDAALTRINAASARIAAASDAASARQV
ncbi:hypothetical protein B0H11DRAFT_1910403 [Mycena galericulata]|nr:hypothetical protein B0H11DRAFT_1910403 [Mycena galericulata]